MRPRYVLKDGAIASRLPVAATDLSETSRPTMGLTQSPIRWVPRALILEEEHLVCETDYKHHLMLSLWVSESIHPVLSMPLCLIQR